MYELNRFDAASLDVEEVDVRVSAGGQEDWSCEYNTEDDSFSLHCESID